MKLTKCANGHFYDGDTYQSCPFCSPSAGAANETIPLDYASTSAVGGNESVTVQVGTITRETILIVSIWRYYVLGGDRYFSV